MLLNIENVTTYYGKIPILRDVSLSVNSKEIVAILGPNGAGKTTLVKTIMGSVKPCHGIIQFDGKNITGLPSHEIAKLGISVVPEGGRIFPELTVFENLRIGANRKEACEAWNETIEMIYELFPILRERKNQTAGTLSGGEQRMLSIGRALMAKPKLIIIDELSLGLAPKIITSIYGTFKKIIQNFSASILVIEQYVGMALENSNRAYLLEYGRIVKEGLSKDLIRDEYIKNVYIGL